MAPLLILSLPTQEDPAIKLWRKAQRVSSKASVKENTLSPVSLGLSPVSCPVQLPHPKNYSARDQRKHRLDPPTTLFHTQVLRPVPKLGAQRIIRVCGTARLHP